MNKLQVKKSNIFQCVESRQIPDDIPNKNNSPYHSLAMANDYVPRIESLRKKIGILVSAIGESKKKTNGGYLAVRIGTDVFKGNEILDELHSAIGVYNILRWEGDDNQVREYWTKNGMNIIGNEWLDYLGDQSIRKAGGHIVVMLSDEGVNQLNEIAHKLYPFVQSSSVTT